MRVVLAVLVLAHGIAHLPGFLVSWQLQALPELPYRTTILGGSIDVGSSGIKVVGLAWLALGAAFVVAAAATLMRAAWWQPFVLTAAALSLVLCVVGWPDTRLGLVANALVLGLLLVGTRSGRL